jgi:hypothetical protein
VADELEAAVHPKMALGIFLGGRSPGMTWIKGGKMSAKFMAESGDLEALKQGTPIAAD